MNLFFSLLFITSVFVSCTIQAPRFISEGIKTEKAISFLELLHEKTPEQLDSHIQYLNNKSYGPGFNWTEYWNEIKKKQLYTNWSMEERDKIFSLSKVSCLTENWSTFIELLIEIARLDSEQPFFHKYIGNPSHPCFSTWVSNAMVKQIVDVLSQKRETKEVHALNRLRRQVRSENLQSVPLEKMDTNRFVAFSTNKSGTVYIYMENVKAKEQFPYTIELQKILVNEWIQNKMLRSWGFIFKDLDTSFWLDSRLINFSSGDLNHLKNTLEMEFSGYGAIRGLDQDILSIFRQSSSMSKLLKLMNYNRYFKASFMNWESLWKQVTQVYPSMPQFNGNAQDLMSLRLFSCRRDDIVSYLRFANAWNLKVKDIHWKGSVIVADWCVSQVRIQEEYSFKNVRSFFEQKLEDQVLHNVDRLIRAYGREKHLYAAPEWRKLIEDHFPESDWLDLMKQLRETNDNLFVQSIWDMHKQVYEGEVPFLPKDIVSVLISEEESLLGISAISAYKEYLGKLHTMDSFWIHLSDHIDEMTDAAWIDLLEYGANICDSNYLNSLLEFLLKFDRLYILFDHFNFNTCRDIPLKDSIREKVLDFSISHVRNNYLQQSLSGGKKAIWQLVHIMSLQKQSDIHRSVLKVNSIEWNALLKKMLYTVSESEFSDSSGLLVNLFGSVNSVYNRVATQSICNFFNQKESYRIISKYDSEMLIGLLNYLDKRDVKAVQNESDYCYSERMNVILFIAGYLMFNNISKDMVPVEYVAHIWNEALRIIDLRERFMNPLDKDDFMLSAKQYVHSWGWNLLKYDRESVEMDDFSFYFYFSTLILDKLSKKMNITEVINHLEKKHNQDFSNTYYSVVKEYVEDFNGEAFNKNQGDLYKLLNDNLFLTE